MKLALDMYQTAAVAVAVLFLGAFLKKRVKLLETFCIPAPVVGGVIFAVFTCVLYATGVAEFVFDETLKNVCMVIFFTSVGFQANLKVLKSGGKALVVFLGAAILLIILQNAAAVGVSFAIGWSYENDAQNVRRALADADQKMYDDKMQYYARRK